MKLVSLHKKEYFSNRNIAVAIVGWLVGLDMEQLI